MAYMQFRKSIATALIAVALVATGCQSQGWGQKQGAGTAIGAVGGGVIGNQFGKGTGNVIATAAGAVIGAWLGNEVGASLDNADRAALGNAQVSAYSAPIGNQIAWNNPNSGNSGVVVPVRDGYDQRGAYCREFQQKVTVGGKTQEAYGTACQQPNGDWKIIN